MSFIQKHKYIKTATVATSDNYGGQWKHEVRVECPEDEASLVSSALVAEPMHAPVLDIDFEAVLLPSSTAGHYHLYLDKQMTWHAYKRLLRALWKAGVIERGFYKMSCKRGASFVRRLPTKGMECDQVLPPTYIPKPRVWARGGF